MFAKFGSRMSDRAVDRQNDSHTHSLTHSLTHTLSLSTLSLSLLVNNKPEQILGLLLHTKISIIANGGLIAATQLGEDCL